MIILQTLIKQFRVRSLLKPFNLCRAQLHTTFSLSLYKYPTTKLISKTKRQFPNFIFTSRHTYCTELVSEANDKLFEDPEYQEIYDRIIHIHGLGQSVFVIQPRVKWGPNQNKLTKAEYQVAEAVTLAETLPYWKVIGHCIVSVKSTRSKTIFGTGTLEDLKGKVNEASATAVFISVNMLTGLQHSALEEEFNLPVFDRYTIVLRIFSDHARTREAKLQISLAEISYIRSRLRNLHSNQNNCEEGELDFVGGPGESFFEHRKKILRDRELKLRGFLKKLKDRRSLLRQNRRKLQLPTVSVVGYTNAGKTALIKILTEDNKLEPKDQLFATLDVTAHAGKLPNYQKVIFMDTVGFISDIPTALVESFTSTLEDVALSDVIVHVRDLHHPDTEGQKETVLQSLQELDLPEKLFDGIIEVGNKVDLLESAPPEKPNCFYISATTGFGVAKLRQEIERKIMDSVGLINCTVRIPMGGQQTSWLYKFGTIKNSWADPEDSEYLIASVILSPANHAKFRHYFGDLFVELED